MIDWQCRWSPTLGNLEATHQETWGTDEYKDNERPTVFFGLYGLPDFCALRAHKGKKAVLWCGSDITHFINGYWLDKLGKIRIDPKSLARWLNNYVGNWVENHVEQEILRKVGIKARVCPSFLGNVNYYQISYKPSNRPKVYSSVSGDDFELYRWPETIKLAKQYPDMEFHLYGNNKRFRCSQKNVIIHGRVPKEKMNYEIQEMQGALRLLPLEGFSEIIAKSVLWGQWPISAIKYPHMLSVEELGVLRDKKRPNMEGRNYYLRKLNNFPWNQIKHIKSLEEVGI